MAQRIDCTICGGESSLFDVVDFNKSCDEVNGNFLPLSGIPFYYSLCKQCGFCFLPELMHWTHEQFREKIYNSEYILVDPDYLITRPQENASTLVSVFGDRAHLFTHLDYGGGNGLLSQLLTKANFRSTSFDPFVDTSTKIENLGKFDLITAFEVFEHIPNISQLMHDLSSLLTPNGIILFSTLLSDGNIHPKQRLNWWYASPRNGHISLFSRQALFIIAQNYGFNFGSFSDNLHIYFTNVPAWADHIIKTN